jgi:hypothetical protein
MADALVSQLARALNLSPDAARHTLNHLVAALREQIDATGSAAVPGLGTFRLDDDDRLAFDSDDALARAVNHRYAGLRPIAASRSLSSHAPPEPEPDDPFAAVAPSAADESEAPPAAEFQPIEAFIEPDDAETEDAGTELDPAEPSAFEDEPVADEAPILEEEPVLEEEPDDRDHPVAETAPDTEEVEDAEGNEVLAGSWVTTSALTEEEQPVDDAPDAPTEEPHSAPFEPERAAEPDDIDEPDDEAFDHPDWTADAAPIPNIDDAELDDEAMFSEALEHDAVAEADEPAFDEAEDDDLLAEDEAGDDVLAEDAPAVIASESPLDADTEIESHEAQLHDESAAEPPVPAVAPAVAATAAPTASRPPVAPERGSNMRVLGGIAAVLLLALVALLWVLNREPAAPVVAEQPPVPADTVAALPIPVDTSAVDTAAVATSEPTPPTPAADPLRSTAGIDRADGGFAWIVASEFSREPAERRVAAFREQGFRADVIAEEAAGRTRYRVALGQFASIEEADRFRSDLPAGVPSDTWLLRL